MKRIAIFASGSGSNAENIAQYFRLNDQVEISIIVSNKTNAFVHQRAKKLGIPSLTITRNMFYKTDQLINILQCLEIDLIVLAGFLWLVPEQLISSFPSQIINVHPALLPKYGGKGMYGQHVHEAVKANGDKETGITIHYVNPKYDEGQIIHQSKCTLTLTDTVEDITKKIHALEFEYFPKVIESLLLK